MKSTISAAVIALALGVAVSAQDSTVKSKTQVKSDDAQTVTMTGCLLPNAAGGYTLSGTMASAGDDATIKSKVKTDVDDEDTKVKSKSTAKIDNDDHKAIGTSGSVSSFDVSARDGVDLAAHAGHKVTIAAVMLDAASKGDDDAKIKIKEDTKVKAEDSPDGKVQSKTKAELPRGANARLMAVSIQQVGENCSQ
jgi:hypothetical protein